MIIDLTPCPSPKERGGVSFGKRDVKLKNLPLVTPQVMH
jgi:hypothetical protein